MFEPQLSLRENLNQASPGWHKPVIPATQEAEAGGLQIQGQPAQISKILPQILKSKKTGRHLSGQGLAWYFWDPKFNPKYRRKKS